MPFDTMALAAVSDELAGARGGQVQRIIQPSESAIALSIYSQGRQRWVLLSADARHARVHFVGGRLAKAFPAPSPFVMLLRKHIESRRLQAVEQIPFERILQLTFPGEDRPVRLMAELMGKHSNIILVDADSTVLGAIKLIPPHQSRVRPILPGRPYLPPPARVRDAKLYPPGERVDPVADTDELANLLKTLPPDTPVRAALAGILPGCSPFMADQIASLSGLGPQATIGESSIYTLTTAARNLYARFSTRTWEPCTFTSPKGACDFAPYRPAGVDAINAAGSMSEAIETCIGDQESRDVLGTARREVLQEIERARRAIDRRVASLQEGLAASADAETVMQRGQLLLAYQHQLAPGEGELRIPELDTVIELNPRLTAQENAERAFRRYRKLRDARNRIPELLAHAETEAARLDDLAGFTRIAGTEAELRELTHDLRPDDTQPGSKTRQEPKSNREKTARPKSGLRYRLDGFLALVGRNARENETVTFRAAHRDDLWLHARGRTGAHVVLHGEDPSSQVLAAAAALAAYHSEGRTDTAVDVDVAVIRDIRKISGGPPGRVTYRNHRTIRTAPGIGEWKRI